MSDNNNFEIVSKYSQVLIVLFINISNEITFAFVFMYVKYYITKCFCMFKIYSAKSPALGE